MKIVVTGHRGYLGRHLCKIAEKHHEIVGWDLGWFDSEPGVRRDIRRLESDDLKDVDLVVHLAAMVGEPVCSAFRSLARSVNIDGTAKVLDACQKRSVPMIFASTCSVYGSADHVLFEDSRFNPLGPYAKDRLIAERMALDSIGTALRFGTLFGWSDRMRFDLVVNKWTLEAVQNKSIRVEGGKQWRPFTHVVDAAQAVCAMIDMIEAGQMGELIGEVFNICTQNCAIIELAQKVRVETGANVEVAENVSDPRNYRVSSDKAEKILGWKPVLSVQQGIREMADQIVLRNPYRIEPIHSNLERLEVLFDKTLKEQF